MSYTKTNWVNGITSANATNMNKIEDELEAIEGRLNGEWITATLNSSFIPYNSSSDATPQYKKIGKFIEIRGVVSPSSSISAGANEQTIFTLPEGYRPSKAVYSLCQGSGKNIWLLTIRNTGVVAISRYGTTTNAEIPTSAWLPFNAMFTVE